MVEIERNMVLIVSAVFPPEPVVSANLTHDIAKQLSAKYDVVVISPKPTRPFGTKYENTASINYPFTHIILKTYTCSKSNLLGRFLESYSLGKAVRKFILSTGILICTRRFMLSGCLIVLRASRPMPFMG